jgi:hypothetical protein
MKLISPCITLIAAKAERHLHHTEEKEDEQLEMMRLL